MKGRFFRCVNDRNVVQEGLNRAMCEAQGLTWANPSYHFDDIYAAMQAPRM